MHTGVTCTIPLDTDGKHVGYFELPYSVDRSPFYRIQIPVCHVQNGQGPSVLLMAGVHGDEYEGKLALARLIRELKPEQINGSVTILPVANAPAVYNASRCSPFDDGNLNRMFPGDHAGSPTSRIAHLIEHHLMSGRDYVFDLHSGGTSMAHMTCVLCEVGYGEARDNAAKSLLGKLGIPFALTADNGRDSPTTMAAANRAGCVAVSGEFGGGGTATTDTLAQTYVALDHFMMAIGLTNEPVLGAEVPAQPTVFINQTGGSGVHTVAMHGWFEPVVEIGDIVVKGQLAGRIVDLVTLTNSPQEIHFKCDGIVTSRRLHTEVRPGDCVLTVAQFV